MLSCKIDKLGALTDSDLGETSLAQNFKDIGVLFDQMFQEKKYQQIVDGWKEIIKCKPEKVRREQSVDEIYYILY